MGHGPQPALTIYTDASWVRHNKEGVGSWGAVIRGYGKEVQLSGQFKGPCPNSTAAELQGIANALHHALVNGLLDGEPVAVVCDCSSVVAVLRGKGKFRPKNRETHQRALDLIKSITGRAKAEVTFHWVRGHQSGPNACEHAAGNRLADQLAAAANTVVVDRKEKVAARRKRRRAKVRQQATESKAQLAAKAVRAVAEATRDQSPEAVAARRAAAHAKWVRRNEKRAAEGNERAAALLARAREAGPGIAEQLAQLDAQRRREEQRQVHEACHAILREPAQ